MCLQLQVCALDVVSCKYSYDAGAACVCTCKQQYARYEKLYFYIYLTTYINTLAAKPVQTFGFPNYFRHVEHHVWSDSDTTGLVPIAFAAQ